uniref:Spermatosis associated 16 n=1 Tax=Seriola lalandi dorsalis TaxID=1841481 RepID=A0A3B4WIV6_SERLL
SLKEKRKMRCNKRTADPETDQTPKSHRTSPATTPAESTGQEVKRLKRQSDISQEKKDVKKKDIEDDKGEKQTDCVPQQSISLKKLWNVENSLALGKEMLPVFNKSSSSSSLQTYLPSHTVSSSSLSRSQAHKSRELSLGPNLSFLPPIEKELFTLLTDANLYCRTRRYAVAVKSLCTALQLSSKGHVLKDTHCADPNDIELVFSYIEARLVVCYLRMKKPQLALIHAHRISARSAMILELMFFLNTSKHKLSWDMLSKAQLMEGISVIYIPYHGDPTAKDISQAIKTSIKQHPAFTGFIYTDPRGGHVLPQTTDWLSAGAVPQRYLITLGFRRREDGIFLKKMYSRIWPSLPGPCTLCVETQKIRDMYEKILPILDLMQTTQINVSVCVGSGLIEWLQYGSLLLKLGYHREHSTILHCCQAQLTTAPYLPQISTQQENTPLLQALLTDIMDELGRRRTSTERVWNKMLKVKCGIVCLREREKLLTKACQ